MSLTEPGSRPGEILTRGLRPRLPDSPGATTRPWSPDAIARRLPDGWRVKVAKAWSMAHDAVLWTIWLDEPSMGWSEWHASTDPGDLLVWALGYVDQCMASCLPDTGLVPRQDKASPGLEAAAELCGHCNACAVCRALAQRQGAPQAHRGACPVCSGQAGAVMHVNCVMR